MQKSSTNQRKLTRRLAEMRDRSSEITHAPFQVLSCSGAEITLIAPLGRQCDANFPRMITVGCNCDPILDQNYFVYAVLLNCVPAFYPECTTWERNSDRATHHAKVATLLEHLYNGSRRDN
jgi:hypothetical protein